MWLDIFIQNPVIQIIFIILITILLHRASGKIIMQFLERTNRIHPNESKSDQKKRIDTVGNIFGAAAGLVIWLIAVSMILAVLHFNIASLATGAGFFGIVIGIGAQATIRDYLAGIAILLENQYRVGDVVTLRGGTTGLGVTGIVEQLTLRITKLRDLDGTLNIVRNGDASIITNRTFGFSSVVLDIDVAYNSDIDAVERIMNIVGKEMLNDKKLKDEIREPVHFLRVEGFAESSIVVKAVGKVTPAMQWEVEGEYRRRLLKAFKKEGIQRRDQTADAA